MKKSIISAILLSALILLLFSGCRKPLNSANGDNLTPNGVSISLMD